MTAVLALLTALSAPQIISAVSSVGNLISAVASVEQATAELIAVLPKQRPRSAPPRQAHKPVIPKAEAFRVEQQFMNRISAAGL